MPWCPICKNEYKEGYTHCNDCDADLVPTFEDLPKAVMFGNESDMNFMLKLLKENGLKDAFLLFSDKEQCYELYVDKDQVNKAKEIITVYMQKQMEAQNGLNYDADDSEIGYTDEMIEENAVQNAKEKVARARISQTYSNKKEKALENKSSAYSLLLVGVLGLAALICVFLKIIPLNLPKTTAYMMYGVMGTMFLIFIVAGIASLNSYKKLLEQDEVDQDIINKAKEYLSTISVSMVEKNVDTDVSDEMKYFKRFANIKNLLQDQFPEVPDDLLEHIAEEYYDNTFGTEYSTEVVDQILEDEEA